MSGDYSRWSFEPWRDFGAVLMQQGRVHTDADWNEWSEILRRRLQAETVDALGRAVVPLETPDGFKILLPAPGKLTIGLGRAYVDGLLAENHGSPREAWDAVLAELRGSVATEFNQQPYVPDAPALPATGTYVAYLKVWLRELTAIEMPDLVEKALGVDTTTRVQTAWQVKLVEAGASIDCGTPLETIPAFVAQEPAAAGRLTTDTAEVPGEPDPCLVPPGGGYTGAENQLYRVEVHRGGKIGGPAGATFKWSRDNATVATRVTEIPPTLDRLVVDQIGRDDILSLHDGDWIEITDDWRELAGTPGEMRRIKVGGGVDRATNTVLLEAALAAGAFPVDAQGRTIPARNTRVRRWDEHDKVRDAAGNELQDLNSAGSDGTILIPGGHKKVLLEQGIVVSFDLEPNGGLFRTGDYWVFAARTVDASIEHLVDAPPRGIHAHYAPLALVTFPSTVTDCRTVFPPLGGLDSLEYVAGDGQEATPDLVNPVPVPLPIDPTVGVARGPIPVAGRTVRFSLLDAVGSIGGVAGPIDVVTAADGLASAGWTLDPGTPVQRLQADLLDANGSPTSLPVRFSARLRTADVVAYDPKACPDLAGVTTVQEAIDKLCGGTDHGDCCATVGSTGEFRTIEEALEVLSKRHDGHVCICLLPERHRLRMEQIGSLRTLTIGGRGAVVEFRQALELIEIEDVAIRDVTLVEHHAAKGIPHLIGTTACGRVTFTDVTATVAQGSNDGSVIAFGPKSSSVGVRGCDLTNATKQPLGDRLPIRDELPEIARRLIELAERVPPGDEATAGVTELLGRDSAERLAAVEGIGAVAERHREALGSRDAATLSRLGEFIGSGESIPPARLRDLLGRIGRLGARLAPATAGSRAVIEFADGEGDAWLEDNRIGGGVVVYGPAEPDFEAKFDNSIFEFLKAAQDRPQRVAIGVGRLRVEDNLLDWIGAGSKFEGSTLFADLLVHNNSFQGRAQALVATAVAASANTFSREDERPVGLVLANAATVVGNIGPNARPILVVSAADRASTANVRLNVQP